MDYIDNILSAVEDTIKSQPVEKCRKNVFVTLGELKKDYPEKSQYIDDKFKEFCLKYKKNFYEDLIMYESQREDEETRYNSIVN